MRTGERILDRWEVLAPLGAGVMGEVHLVADLRTKATYALKSLFPGGDAEARLRFLREAEGLARVDRHPHVVGVHTLAEGPDGRLFLLMDHLPGGTLAERVARGPLAPAEVRALGVALADGLEHCHQRGLLHRDVKPHNVLFDAAGSPRLADFGLVRLAGASALTTTGALVGTPATMAPEQFGGDPAAIGPACDVYGLGATLYWAACGSPPFEGRTPVEVLARAATDRPPSLAERVPGFPSELEAVIRRALERDPAARWPSAAALGSALREPAAPGPAGRLSPGWIVGGLAGVCAALVAVLALHGPGRGEAGPVAPPADPSRSGAERPLAAAADEPLPATVEAALAREDGQAALEALERAWPAGDRSRLVRWVVAALLLEADPAAPERWAARGEALSGREGRELLALGCAGVTGGELPPGPSPLRDLFVQERALDEIIQPVQLGRFPPGSSLGRELEQQLQRTQRAAAAASRALGAPVGLARLRWRLFRALPRLTGLLQNDMLPGAEFLGALGQGEEPSARAVRLGRAWLSEVCQSPRTWRPPAPLVAAPGDDWEALPAPGGALAQVLLRAAELRLDRFRDPPERVLASWARLRAALIAWRGPGLPTELCGERGLDLVGLEVPLCEAMREALDACVRAALARGEAPPESEELLAALGNLGRWKGEVYRVALDLALGRADRIQPGLAGLFPRAVDQQGLGLILEAEAALAVEDVLRCRELLNRLDRLDETVAGVKQAGQCLRALLEVVRDPEPDGLARAQAVLHLVSDQEPLLNLLPWRTRRATQAALLACEAGQWRPRQEGRTASFPPPR